MRRFDRNLVELLRRGGSYTEEEILAHLNVEPSDVELVKAVDRRALLMLNCFLFSMASLIMRDNGLRLR